VVQQSLGTKENPMSPITYLESYVRLFIDAREPEPLIESADGTKNVGAKRHVAAFHAIDETLRFERGIARGKANNRVYVRRGSESCFSPDVGPKLNSPSTGSTDGWIGISASMLENEIRPRDFHVIVEKEQNIASGGEYSYIASSSSTSAAVAKNLHRKAAWRDGVKDFRLDALVHDDDLSVLIRLELQVGNGSAQVAWPVESGNNYRNKERFIHSKAVMLRVF